MALEHSKQNIIMFNLSEKREGPCVGHANGEVQPADIGGDGEAWRFVPVGNGSPNYFIMGCGGEHHLYLSHGNGQICMTDYAGEGEHWNVIDEFECCYKIKATGGESHLYLGHDMNGFHFVEQGQENFDNALWRIIFRE